MLIFLLRKRLLTFNMSKSNYSLYIFWDGFKLKAGICKSKAPKRLGTRLLHLVRGRSEENFDIVMQMHFTHVFECSTDAQVIKLENAIHAKFDEYRLMDHTKWKTEYFSSEVSSDDILQEIRDYAEKNSLSQVKCVYKKFYGVEKYEK